MDTQTVIGGERETRTAGGGCLLMSVIALPDDGVTWGVNARRSNSTDKRRYRKEATDED